MTFDTSTLVSVAVPLVAGLVTIAVQLDAARRAYRRAVEKVDAALERLDKLEALANSNQRMTEFFWKLFEQHAVKLLHSPHREELDLLLEAYAAGRHLSESELTELIERLRDIEAGGDPEATKAEVAAASNLLLLIEFRIGEALKMKAEERPAT